MNYSESAKILEEIKKAKKILLNCHHSPDPDAVGCTIALAKVLRTMGKEVKMICSDDISEDYYFLPISRKIQKVDFASFNFSPYDLFIISDSGNWQQVSGGQELMIKGLSLILIDHHPGNDIDSLWSIVRPEISSTSEILYKVFQDWGINIDGTVATALLMGIMSDTIFFQHLGLTKETFYIAGDLIGKGADKDRILLNLYKSLDFKTVRLAGEMIARMKIDEKHKFVWSAIPFRLYSKYIVSPGATNAKEIVATYFSRCVKDTLFGILVVEIKKGAFSISIRGREGFDVSKIAKEIGGGGHEYSAGARFKAENFKEGVNAILEITRKVVSVSNE